MGLESFTMECEEGEECCGSLREYFEKTVEGVTTTHMVGRHSCEKELSGVGDYGVVCNGHTDACYNITRDQINTIEALWAKACFCSGDKCNTDVPTWSDPDLTTTPAPGSAIHPFDKSDLCYHHADQDLIKSTMQSNQSYP